MISITCRHCGKLFEFDPKSVIHRDVDKFAVDASRVTEYLVTCTNAGCGKKYWIVVTKKD